MSGMRTAGYLNRADLTNGHVAVAIDFACEQARGGPEGRGVSETSNSVRALKADKMDCHAVPDVARRLRFSHMARDLHIRPDAKRSSERNQCANPS